MLRNLTMTEKEYSSSELLQNPPSADVYIAGSDQVWSYVSTETFLRFGDKKVKRLAYAVSMRWMNCSEEWRSEAKKAVKEFDAISVREFEGLAVCREIGRDDAVHVVDPVLLLEKEDYIHLIEKENAAQSFNAPFILAYLINVEDLSHIPWKEIRDFETKEKKDLKVVALQGTELLIPEEYLYVPQPAEWINAFVRCTCVITNSFHGMLFAIIMRKPFLVVLLEGSFSSENCRFFSVLKRLGLEDRIYRRGEASITQQMHIPINWEAVECKLKAFKDESFRFLMEHLK